MVFLNPQGFYSLLWALPIIALYILRLHYTDTVVPSLLLWQSVLQDRHANQPWQKFRKHWLLYLQLLVLFFISLSLAQPVLPGPISSQEPVLILVDISASLLTQTEQGGNRFSRAVQQLRHALSAYHHRDNLTLITVGDQPRVVLHRVDANRISSELANLEPGQGGADWASAARLAQGVVGDSEAQDVTTIIASDLAFDATATSPELHFPGELVVINVGDNQSNAGFVHFSVRRTGQTATAFARIQNAGISTTRTLDILADGILYDRQTLTLPADEELAVSVPDIPAVAWIEMKLVERDAFPLDDRAWTALEQANQKAALLVSSGNRFLAQALANLPFLEFYQTHSLPEDGILPAEYATLVMDLSPVPPLPAANMWLIAPDGNTICGEPEQAYAQPTHITGKWDHPLLQYVDWSDVHLQTVRKYHLPATAEVVLSTSELPVLWTVEDAGYKTVCMAFRIQDGDLPLRLAFPILTSNIMDWLSSNVSTEPQIPLRPGDRWMPTLPANTTDAFIIDPDNNQSVVPLDGSGVLLNTVGLYRVLATTPSGQVTSHVAVSLIDAQESDLRVRNAFFTSAESASQTYLMGQRDISRWTIALAVMLCLLEAILWWSRGYRISKTTLPRYVLRSGNLFALFLRLVMLVSLLGAFWGIRLKRQTRDLGIVFVVDQSDSTRASWETQVAFITQTLTKKAPRDQAAVIVFGQDAWVDRSLSSDVELSPFTSIPFRDATNIEQAVQLATAMLAEDVAGRIVLLSDGLETVGQGQRALIDAVSQGIDVMLVQTGEGVPSAEVWIDQLRVPSLIFPGDEVPVMVGLATNTPQTLRVNWSVGTEASYAYVDLLEKESVYQFSTQADITGFVPIRVCVEPVNDTYIDNNCADNWLVVQNTPQILVVGTAMESAAFVTAIKSAGFQAVQIEPVAMPQSVEKFMEYSAVVLVNTPARELTQQSMLNLAAYVQDMGGGLIAIGGPDSYGVGGWLGSPLEQVMPVDMRVQDPQRFPPMVMAIVLDTSGSMSNDENGVQKITLAAEAAVRVSESLNAGDTFLVIGYSDNPDHTIGPIEIGTRRDLKQELYALRAEGGGIYVYESLALALQLLPGIAQDDLTQIQIVILADGSDAEHQPGALGLVNAAVNSGISTSSIAIGGGDDVAFLAALAHAGNGRFYLTEQASELPSIFTEEVARAKRSYIVEKAFYPQPGVNWEPVADLNPLPSLLGYVASSPKGKAEVLLCADDLDPLLAVWHYGLGRSVAWTSDATTRWSANWVKWDGFAPFWASILRDVLMQEMDRDVDVHINYDQLAATVIVDIIGASADDLDLHLRFSGADPIAADTVVDLEQIAPGRYEVEITHLARESYLVRLFGDRDFVFGWAPPPSKEYLPGDAASAMTLLATQSDSQLISDPGEVVERNLLALQKDTPLTLPLITLAAALWVSNIAWRRLALTWRGLLVSQGRFISKLRQRIARVEKLKAHERIDYSSVLTRKIRRQSENRSSSRWTRTGEGVIVPPSRTEVLTDELKESESEEVKLDSPEANLAARLRKGLRDRDQHDGR